MKNSKIIVIVAIVLTVIFITSCGIIRVNETEEEKRILAKVDGEIISKEDFDKIFAVYKTQVEANEGSDIWEKTYDGKKYIDLAKEQVLEQMIKEKVQLNKAEELNILVAQEEIDAEYEKFKKLFNTEEKFIEYLAEAKMDIDYFKESIWKGLIINKLKDNLTIAIEVSDEELEAYYATHMDMFFRVKASHILLETEEEAKEILVRVHEGEDFNTLAKEYSIDPSVKENGGDLGYFRHGNMVEPFEEAAFSLKPGEISDIVESQYGFHIIKVEDRKIDELDDVKDELKTSMLIDKKSSDYGEIFQKLYDEAKIEKFLKRL